MQERTKNRPRSQQCYEALCKVIPGGVNSPVRAFLDLDIAPLVVDSGLGDTIVDIDGNSYVDYCMSWGAVIHGHSHPEIVKAATTRLVKGSSFGATTAIEERLAKAVISMMPSLEKVRLVSSGTEAAMTAARLARGFTGKKLLLKFSGCYHGHADFFLIKAGSGVSQLAASTSAGIPPELVQSTLCLPYNDIEAFEEALRLPEIRDNLACVFIEPIAANMGLVPATSEFLEVIRKRTKEIGALLIFDEVISGFRVAKGGAQELYGIVPDLTCFGKVIGGGYPAAGFGGKSEIMDFLAPLGPVYQAGTLSGNPIAMEAGLKALEMVQEPDFYKMLDKKARIITDPVQELLQDKEIPACLNKVGSLFSVFVGQRAVTNGEQAKAQDLELFKKLFYHMFDNGIYIPPSPAEAWFISAAHSEAHLEMTRDLLLDFLKASIPNSLCHFAVL